MDIKKYFNQIIKNLITLNWSYTSKSYLAQMEQDPELKWANEILKTKSRHSTGEDLIARKKALRILNLRGYKYCD